MIKEIDPELNPDHLNAPTEAEIAELTQRVTPASRSRLEDAARALLLSKMMASDITPWRALVNAYRSSEPFRTEVEVVDDGGVPRLQVVYIERGFGLSGAAGRLHACVGELVRAMDLIERERERNRANGAKRGSKAAVQDLGEAIAAFLRRKNYESSFNKKELRIEAQEHFGVGKTTVTNAITKHKLSTRS